MQNKALLMVLELEQSREEKLAREFGQARSQLDMQQRRLEGLTSYRTDYLHQANNKAQQGIGSASFGRYHAFVGKLDEGINQQQQSLQKMQSQVEQLRQNWLSQQQRRKAIEHLIDKREQAAEKKRSRQEQVTADEYAMQGFLRRKREM
ncbi:flagellar export protein FliJ [Aliidiomarina taiwanensis]|uniref:Flagellar FliJ protein n=1 Tax=Aliidiomarina taiwanensis TaxID=946228 RepID=A0A432WZ58_9GAMM|nr:flagellar export protein FliJ [Aliidiomarina taiwanensis]RUO39042.1 flagellar export protein FliJ [Aliidiomarina taiwanensis]